MAMKLQYSALTRRVLLLGSVALTLSAAAPTWAQELEKVSVRLDWLPGADHAALYLAKERGYYKDGGLDVEILPGQGSTSTI
ncbi:hypothetical protein EN935_31710, partial [Mesorhizobium sp. M7D.F.Ca.US.004.03.1.1]|uniref:ABC transporter substrate-binding protein n=1 Tax=Mesorhizobium sp. M7D.F.Ca.US.004.03.1.1 TaxID=2496702 RepID=UPI000FD4A63E